MEILRKIRILLLVLVAISAAQLYSVSLEQSQMEIQEIRLQLRGICDELKSEQFSLIKEQSPFEKDSEFLQRYLRDSGQVLLDLNKKRGSLLARLKELLEWNYQTRSMEINLDADKYDANSGLWQVDITHHDWAADTLNCQLQIESSQAKALYENQSAVSVWGDIIFDMQSKPRLTTIYLSCEPAQIDTSFYLGALEMFAFPNTVTALDFDEKGKTLLAGCRDKNLYKIDLIEGVVLPPLRIYSNITEVKNYCSKNQAIAALQEGYLRVFDIDERKELAQFRHLASVVDMEIDISGRFAITASLDTRLRIYDLKNNSTMLELEYPYGIKTCSLSADGKYIAYGTEKGYSNLYDYAVVRILETGKKDIQQEFICSNTLDSVDLNSDGSKILYSTIEGETFIADINTGAKLFNYNGIVQTQWLADEMLVVGSNMGNELLVIGVESQQLIKKIVHQENIACFAIDKTGNYTAIGSQSGVYIYKL